MNLRAAKNSSWRWRTIILSASIMALPTVAAAQPAEAITILPLGDSRVEGARPEFESYRFALWSKLIAAGHDIDFIGPLEDEAHYPPVLRRVFDPDHAGVGGFTTRDILDAIEDEALDDTLRADIVLLGIGGNDLLGGRTAKAAVSNVDLIVRNLRAMNPDVIIFMEQIAPGHPEFMTKSATRNFQNYNQLLSNWARQTTTLSSPIIIVDMRDGWSPEFLADPVHYNEAGANHVAERYFDALEPYLKSQ